jgi:hypothetical protein
MCRRRSSWPLVVACVVLAVSGCGGDGKVRVNGTVTLDGQPLEGAIVTFLPVEKGQGQIAHGTTDKDGAFDLTTSRPNDGAFPGEYKVTVVYAEGAAPPPSGNVKDAFAGLKKAQGQKLKAPKFSIPGEYGDPARTTLRQKVPAEGRVVLALKKK